jgi:hypothetical protein
MAQRKLDISWATEPKTTIKTLILSILFFVLTSFSTAFNSSPIT